jgi:hypothetical protein
MHITGGKLNVPPPRTGLDKVPASYRGTMSEACASVIGDKTEETKTKQSSLTLP